VSRNSLFSFSDRGIASSFFVFIFPRYWKEFAVFFHQRSCSLIGSANTAFRCFSYRVVQLLRCFSAGQGSAASSLLFVRAVQLFLCFSAWGNRLSGARWACDTSFCERRTLFLSASSEDNGLCISGPTSEIVTLGQAGPTVILAAQISLCEFHATRRIRFDVSDLFQK
jgi:hypothetical protein